MNGAVAHYGGLAAEDLVERAYEASGHRIVARRWRSAAGEIDLIARTGEEVIFIEVKQATDFASAAARVRPRQAARILAAAELFLAGEPLGANTASRVDVALVDGLGRLEIIENALCG